MRRPTYRLTKAAAEDIEHILIESARLFGPLQRDRYASLIEKAMALIVENPARVGSRDRSDLAPRLRSFHVELAAGRLGASSHIIFYVPAERGVGVLVIRALHESMDPGRHIGPEAE